MCVLYLLRYCFFILLKRVSKTLFQVKSLLRNTELVTSLDLSAMLSRLDLSKEVSDTRRPVNDKLYPNNWVGDQQAEGRHKEAFLKMINWPTYVVTQEKNMVGN